MRRATVALALSLTLAPLAHAQTPPAPLRDFLQRQMLLSPSDIVAVTQGRIVSTLPPAQDPREIAAFGIARVTATDAAVVGNMRDVSRYIGASTVTQGGRFSSPPVMDDVAALTLEESDLQGLRSCRPGRCAMKLSASMVERFSHDVSWSAPDWRAQATRVFRRMLVDYVTAYLSDGASALPTYVDQSSVVALSEETRSLWRDSPDIAGARPALLDALARPPLGASTTLTHTMYWSKEQFGFKPTIAVFDLAIHEPRTLGAQGRTITAVSTQLYASHYFEGSVALTMAVTTTDSPSQDGLFMMHLHRARVDSLRRGRFTWLTRFGTGRRIRRRLEDDLGRLLAGIASAGARSERRGRPVA